jgi:REP element-mobilizing transposase RayT
MRYFITFRCYGAHVHGAEAGSVDRNHNLPGSRTLDADLKRAGVESEAMTQAPYLLDQQARPVVLAAIREVSAHRRWNLLAPHVRTNHVHVIVESEARPEKVMNDFKSYSSRALNKLARDGADRRLGAPWEYAMAMGGSGCSGRYSVCCRRAGGTDGFFHG